MNKSELIEHIAKATRLTKVGAGEALEAVIGGISKALKRGEEVALVGFGTFKVRSRAARMGRNPQTGAVINIRATKVAAFKAGKALKEQVAGGKKN